MYAHKPTSESLNPAASLTNVRTDDSRTVVPGQRHLYSHTQSTGILSLSPKSDCKGTKKLRIKNWE